MTHGLSPTKSVSAAAWSSLMPVSARSLKVEIFPWSSLPTATFTMAYTMIRRRDAGSSVSSSLELRVCISLAHSTTGRRCRCGSSSVSMTMATGRSASLTRQCVTVTSIASLSTGAMGVVSVSPPGLLVWCKTPRRVSSALRSGHPRIAIPSVTHVQLAPKSPL